MIGRSPLKMDKFRRILLDAYYCGVVQISKQVQATNQNGLHKALISPETHRKLIEVMNGRPKTQSGPMKDGNPDFPLNNRIGHKLCDEASNGRLVGFKLTNGKNKERVYYKYRCRACGTYINREDLHEDIMAQFKKRPMTDNAKERIANALETAWKRREREATQQAQALKQKIEGLTAAVKMQAVEAIKPEHAAIKAELLAAIVDVKAQIAELENDLQNLQTRTAASKTKFLRFALDFIANMEKRFLEIGRDNRLRLEQIIFPGGFILNADKKVLTPKISPFYRLEAIKKSAEALNDSLMVRVKGL